MPFLLVRDGKIVVQDTRLARESCTQCCDGSEPRWFEVVDCCYPDESFWIQVGQLGRNGEQLYTPGVPVTIRYGPHCATTRPDVALTYDEIIALDPDADFVFYLQGQGPEVVPAGCEDPLCQPCPQCCVVRHISEDTCGGPACCEHGGSFTVNISGFAIYQQFRRVYGWQGTDPNCLECFKWSSEVQSALSNGSYFITVRFTCNGDGTYTGTCLGGRSNATLVRWNVTGPQGHGCDLDNGFGPVRTQLPVDTNVDESCAEMFGNNESPSTWFNTDLIRVKGKIPVLLHGDGLPDGGITAAERFGRDCVGQDIETDNIDRTWTTDPCEALLSQIGDVRRATRTWSGSQTCDGGSFAFEGSFEAGISTRFINLEGPGGVGGWYPWVSRESFIMYGNWSIQREGSPTCADPQCVGNPGGLPPLLFDRRAAVPAIKQSEARGGCAKCGQDGGL